MFLFGILAVCQILLLPGLIFRSLFKPKGNFFFQLSSIVAISMLFNATIIYPMVHLHIYTKTIFLIIILVEVVAILWLYRGVPKVNLNDFGKSLSDYAKKKLNSISELFQDGNYSGFVRFFRSILLMLIVILSLSLIYWFFRKIPNNIGTVFNEWDAVVSWNNWAQSWAQNRIPGVHLTYPQLLPLNLSITYLLTGNYEVSLFAKAIMPIFALLTVFTLLELGLDQKKYGIIAAVILVYLLYKKYLGTIIADGYADLPVAFFAFIALVPYLESEDFLQSKKDLILSLLIAAAAVLTKQVGIFIFIFLPITGLLNSKMRNKKLVLQVLLWTGLALLLILPWYLPMGIRVLQDFSTAGFDQYLAHSTAVQGSESPLIRFSNAFLNLGKYAVPYLFLIPAFFIVNRRYKLIIVLFLVPFSILWGIIASYSVRNLSITFICLAIIAGLGMEYIVESVFRFFERVKVGKLSSLFLALLLILPVGFFALKLDEKKLISTWEQAQNNIFSPEINEQLRSLDRSNPECQRILTNYPVDYLPGMKGMQFNSYLEDYDNFLVHIQEPDVCWLLVPNYADIQVREYIAEKIEKGDYQLLFATEKWVPYQLIKIR